jgi:hypothetical protein
VFTTLAFAGWTGARALGVPEVLGGADCSSPVLTSELELATFGCGAPSSVAQSRQEAEDADIRALSGGLKSIQEIRVERKAEAMRTGHVPRILAGLKRR